MNINTELLLSIQVMRKLYAQYMKEVGVRFNLQETDTDIIGFLKFNPGMDTANDIISLRRFSKASVSQAVERLSVKGYLLRKEDVSDRRRIHLVLTKKAGPVTEAIEAKRKEFTELLFQGFTQKEITACEQFTRRMVENAQAVRRSR
jgi:DNA-binding MarR family transcriptional regulator